MRVYFTTILKKAKTRKILHMCIFGERGGLSAFLSLRQKDNCLLSGQDSRDPFFAPWSQDHQGVRLSSLESTPHSPPMMID